MALLSFPFGAAGVEEPAFEIIDRIGEIEVRRYEAHNVALTQVEGEFSDVGNQAFRRLAGYIFGDNSSDTKIAMTAPVSQAATEPGRYWVTFTMPREYDMNSLPTPDDDRVQLRAVPAETMAAVRYRGGWSEEKYHENERILLQALAASPRWQVSGPAVWARYNPPFTLPFLRRNEVLVPVSERAP